MTQTYHESLAKNAYDADVESASTPDLMKALLINATGGPAAWLEFEGETRATRRFLEALADALGVDPDRDNVRELTAAILGDAGVPYSRDRVAPGNHVSSDTLRALLLALVLEQKRAGYVDEETRAAEDLIDQYAPDDE